MKETAYWNHVQGGNGEIENFKDLTVEMWIYNFSVVLELAQRKINLIKVVKNQEVFRALSCMPVICKPETWKRTN